MNETSQDAGEAGATSRHDPASGDRQGPLWALLRFWPVAVVLAVVGVVLGVLGAGAQTTTYTAESRVAVGYGDLSAGAIAGFPIAATELASNYSRYVNDQGLSGNGFPGVSLSSSPIPDSNVIRIEAVSTNRRTALSAVAKTARDLVSVVNDGSSGDTDQLLDQYLQDARASAEADTAQDSAERRLNQAQADPDTTRAQINELRAGVVDARTAAAGADLKQRALEQQYINSGDISDAADLLVVNKGAVTGDDARSRQQRYGLLGAVVGLAAALVVATLLDRRRPGARRLRRG